jgi:hypothetical protein
LHAHSIHNINNISRIKIGYLTAEGKYYEASRNGKRKRSGGSKALDGQTNGVRTNAPESDEVQEEREETGTGFELGREVDVKRGREQMQEKLGAACILGSL